MGSSVGAIQIEGHVTQVGQRISPLVDVVRGEVIVTATTESDVTEDNWQVLPNSKPQTPKSVPLNPKLQPPNPSQAEYIKVFGCPPPMEKLYDDETRAMTGWYEGDVDKERELERARAQGWLEDTDARAAAAQEQAVAARAQAAGGNVEVDVEEDFSPQARFLRDRQRQRQVLKCLHKVP